MEGLKEIRERAGLSQGELATVSGVRQPNIAAYESGSRRLSARMRERLTRAMVRPSDLLAVHRDEIRQIVLRNRGSKPRIFGSVARGEDRAGSDLDLLIDLDDDASLFDLARMHLELEDLLSVRVDVLEAAALGEKHRGVLEDVVPL